MKALGGYRLTGWLVAGVLLPFAIAWGLGWIDVYRPLGLVTLALLGYWPWAAARSLSGESATVGRVSLAARIVVSLLLTGILSDVRVVQRDRALTVIFVIDHSASISDAGKAEAIAYVNAVAARLPARDRAGLVVFGENASVEIVPTRGLQVERLFAAIRPEYSNLQQALELAAAAFPPQGRRKVVLISDGNENAGSILEGATSLAANGIAFDVLPIQRQESAEVLVDNLAMPEEVRDGEPFDVRARILARQAGPAEVAIMADGKAVERQQVQLEAGINPLRFTTSVAGGGFHTVTVRVAAEADTLAGNNSYTGAVFVRGAARVLLVAPTAAETAALAELCRAAGQTVVTATPETLPRTAVGLYGFDCVVLANCPASAFSTDFLGRLEVGVRELGIGLVMSGGEDGFGAGGWDGTAVAAALPVGMEPIRKRKLPKGALVLILHTCEFPDGNFWAKEISKAALRTLSPGDEAGLILFTPARNETWLFPMTDMKEEQHMRLLIDSCEPGDMVSFAPAFKLAREGLMGSDAASRHVIVISDGDPSKPSASDVRALANAKITVSTVAVNPHSPRDLEIMKEIARETGGRYYLVEDPRNLPAVFMREARRVQRGTIIRESFRPELAMATPFAEPLKGQALPLLYGRVAVSAKAGALVDLQAPNEFNDPVLAHWQYGLGRSVALTTDAGVNWAREWVRWEEGSRLWQSLIDWSARPGRGEDLTMTTRADGERGIVAIDALSATGNYRNELIFEGTVAVGDAVRPLVISHSGPGRYLAEFDLQGVGVNMITLSWRDPETGESGLASTALTVPYPPEYRAFQANLPLLHEAVALAGGQVLAGDPERDPVLQAAVPALSQSMMLYGVLAVIAAILFFMEATVRRLVIRRRDLVALAQTLRDGRSAASGGEPEGVSELRRRREATRRPDGSAELDATATADDDEQAPVVVELSAERADGGEKPQAEDESQEQEGYTSRLLAAKKRQNQRRDERD